MSEILATPRTPRPEARYPAAPLLRAVDQYVRRQGGGLQRVLGAAIMRVRYRAILDGTVTPYMVAQLCRVISQDPERFLVNGRKESAPRRRSNLRSGQSRVRLPAGPLLAPLDRLIDRGGWCRLDEQSDRGKNITELLGENGSKAYYRARAEGSATLHTIEAFCDRLGWHPYELYGDAYDKAAFEGLPDDFDPWNEPAAKRRKPSKPSKPRPAASQRAAA
jgi:hypothetical protein